MEYGMDIMDRWPQCPQDEIDEEAREVDAIAKRIGYGHLMQLASALWRKSLKEQGYPEIGAHIPTAICCIKKADIKMTQKSLSHYDELVKDIKCLTEIQR